MRFIKRVRGPAFGISVASVSSDMQITASYDTSSSEAYSQTMLQFFYIYRVNQKSEPKLCQIFPLHLWEQLQSIVMSVSVCLQLRREAGACAPAENGCAPADEASGRKLIQLTQRLNDELQ